jgi:predicted DNA-binding transcriptional regulator AlpA
MALKRLPEIAKIIGVGKSTLSDAMHHMPDFPKPFRRDDYRRKWDSMHVASWIVKVGGKDAAGDLIREKAITERQERIGRPRRIYETGRPDDGSAYCIPAPSDCVMLTNPDLLAFTRRKLVQHA